LPVPLCVGHDVFETLEFEGIFLVKQTFAQVGGRGGLAFRTGADGRGSESRKERIFFIDGPLDGTKFPRFENPENMISERS